MVTAPSTGDTHILASSQASSLILNSGNITQTWLNIRRCLKHSSRPRLLFTWHRYVPVNLNTGSCIEVHIDWLQATCSDVHNVNECPATASGLVCHLKRTNHQYCYFEKGLKAYVWLKGRNQCQVFLSYSVWVWVLLRQIYLKKKNRTVVSLLCNPPVLWWLTARQDRWNSSSPCSSRSEPAYSHGCTGWAPPSGTHSCSGRCYLSGGTAGRDVGRKGYSS